MRAFTLALLLGALALTVATLSTREDTPHRGLTETIEESGRNTVILEDGAPF